MEETNQVSIIKFKSIGREIGKSADKEGTALATETRNAFAGALVLKK